MIIRYLYPAMKVTNPSFNYDQFGQQYSGRRQTDPRIAVHIHQALGNSKTVLNVGAGAGSYEPTDRYVIAVEPSVTMRAQRKTPAVIATAEALPSPPIFFMVRSTIKKKLQTTSRNSIVAILNCSN